MAEVFERMSDEQRANLQGQYNNGSSKAWVRRLLESANPQLPRYYHGDASIYSPSNCTQSQIYVKPDSIHQAIEKPSRDVCIICIICFGYRGVLVKLRVGKQNER